MRIATFYLPGCDEIALHASVVAPDVELAHAALTPAALDRALDHARAARDRTLRQRPVADIIDALAVATEPWRDAGSPWRAAALRALPHTTGLSAPMIAAVLPEIFAPYRRENLQALVRAETGSPSALDGFVPTPWGMRRALGPDLLAHVGAGNVPGLALPVVVAGLLVKATVAVKTPAGDPVLAALFAQSLAAIDPDLAACLVVAHWPGGTRPLDDAIFARADVVSAEGSDDTVADVRGRARGRVLGFGHRTSLAVVAREATADASGVARALARDVGWVDQHGCLSPQVVYVEAGGRADARMVAELLAAELLALEASLPRGALADPERAAVRRFRETAEWRGIAGAGDRIFGGTETTGVTVIYETDPAFLPACANRTVRVKPIPRLEDLPEHLGAWAAKVEAVGFAGPSARRAALGESLAACSAVSRICPVGRMQQPALGWARGGVPRLGALLRWLDIDDPDLAASGADVSRAYRSTAGEPSEASAKTVRTTAGASQSTAVADRGTAARVHRLKP
jgi:hypothetical protein